MDNWPGTTETEKGLLTSGRWIAWEGSRPEPDHWDRYVGEGEEHRRQTIVRLWWQGENWELSEQNIDNPFNMSLGEQFSTLEETVARAETLRGSHPIMNPYTTEAGRIVLRPDLAAPR